MALTAPSAVLTGSTIASSFDQLLFVDAAAGMTEATLKIVSTEVGKSALSISDEHVLIKGVDTNNAAGFEVQQTDGTSILKVAAGTPSVLVSGSGTKLYLSDAGGEYISGDGTDLTITSGNDIILALGATGSVYHTGDGGTSNTIYGKTAGDSLASGGNYNALIGENAGTAVSTGDGNIAIGFEALKTEDAGSGNVAVGYQALETLNNDNGYNIAMGHNAMQAATTAYYNICIGKDAGTAMAAAVPSCVIIGHEAGDAINHADAGGTVAIGRSAGGAITSGQFNTAVGYQSLEKNVIGNDSTAVGYQALQDMVATSDGYGRNTAIGSKAALNLTDATQGVYIGFLAGGAGAITGNSNIAIGVECGENLGSANENTFIGTQAGRDLTTGSDNVAIGVSAFDAASVGESYNVAIGSGTMGAWDEGSEGGSAQIDHNIAIGYNAFFGGDCGAGSETAVGNIAIGAYALDATSADDHTGAVAIGHQALSTNTSASGNIGIGYQAGLAVTSGANNTFLGYQAGLEHETGARNTVIGYEAMFDTGANSGPASNDNIFIGYRAGGGTWSSFASERNVGIGNYAMDGAMNGSTDNTCIGHEAGTGMAAAAIGNTCIGANAGDGVTTGDNNVLLGKQAGTSSSPVTVSTGDNQLVVGNDSIANSYVKVDWTVGSDIRDKTDIETLPDVAGLNFVNQMRPVTYRWDNRSDYYEFGHKKFGERDHSKKSEQNEVGFIAQEVKEIEKSIGWEDDHIVNTRDENKYKLMYSQVTPILVKAIQELSQQVEDLKAKIE